MRLPLLQHPQPPQLLRLLLWWPSCPWQQALLQLLLLLGVVVVQPARHPPAQTGQWNCGVPYVA
jgi:hypothetical protein